MRTDEALKVCQEWLDYLDRQEAKAKRMSELATMARKGPEQQKQAQKEMRAMNRQPRVYDGGRLRPAVICLMQQVLKEKDDET